MENHPLMPVTEAIEAVAATKASEASGTTEMSVVADELAGKLTRYPGPSYRKAYFTNLLASGSRLHAAGDIRAGAYCFEKVAEAMLEVSSQVTENAPTADAAPLIVPTPTSELEQASPLETIRHRMRKDHFTTAEAILRKQARRLSTLENQIYREKLDALKSAGDAADTLAQVSKIDDKLLDLRRKLYTRILKAQKTALRSRRVRHTTVLQIQGPEAAAAPKFIVGPYNDVYNLGDLLTLIGKTDSPWVEEFLDLYRSFGSLKGLTPVGPA